MTGTTLPRPLPRPGRRPALLGALLALTTALTGGLALSGGTARAFQGNPDSGPVADGSTGTGQRCSPLTDRVFRGTLQGADGLAVNATIGFDATDAQSHTMDLATGCPAHGYSTVVQLNHGAPATGVGPGFRLVNPDGSTSGPQTQFELRGLPADVQHVWIEVYPRGPQNPHCQAGNGVHWDCAGLVDTSKYGAVNRREVPLDGGPVDLRLPVVGGSAVNPPTGSLAVDVVKDGKPWTAPVRAYAWSMLTPDGTRYDQGWGFGAQTSPGHWVVPALGSQQDYRARFYLADDGSRYVEVQHLQVRPGSTTAFRFDVGQLDLSNAHATLDLQKLPARTAQVRRVEARPAFRCVTAARGTAVTFRCQFPTSVRQNTVAAVSYWAYGTWIRMNVRQVDRAHRATLVGVLRYRGTQPWRVTVGRYTVHYAVTGG